MSGIPELVFLGDNFLGTRADAEPGLSLQPRRAACRPGNAGFGLSVWDQRCHPYSLRHLLFPANGKTRRTQQRAGSWPGPPLLSLQVNGEEMSPLPRPQLRQARPGVSSTRGRAWQWMRARWQQGGGGGVVAGRCAFYKPGWEDASWGKNESQRGECSPLLTPQGVSTGWAGPPAKCGRPVEARLLKHQRLTAP